MENFHFYHELKKDKYYTPLVPQREAGLVIILLYEEWKTGKYPSNSFTENIIKKVIEQVAFDLGKSYERTPHERFKEINLSLQEYFLFRNEETNLYNITQYGQEFCERIREKLIREFRPSDIEKILADLIELLKKYIEKGDFIYWYKNHFLLQKNAIKNQVETLLKQVENSVKEFRVSIKSDDQTFLETVRKVDENLQIIGKHTKELRDAFFEAEEVKGLVLQLTFENPSQEILDSIKIVRLFLEDINNDLNIISHRIERVRPKLRQFIASINQRNFDRNTENLLRFLLRTSTLTRDVYKKKIQFPKEVQEKVVFESESMFTIVEKGRLFPKQPTPLVRPKKDTEKREKQLEQAKDRMRMNKRIRYWLNNVDLQIKTNNSVDFTKIYFEILESESDYGKTIALKVANTIFRKYSKLSSYEVNIEKKIMIATKYPDQGIWKMNIQRLQDK